MAYPLATRTLADTAESHVADHNTLHDLAQEFSQAPTVLVAASNASAKVKAAAHYVCDGTDDHVEINAAISEVSTAGGGTVVLSEGLFLVSAHCEMKSKVSLIGAGQEATIVRATTGIATGRGVINPTPGVATTDVTISRLTVDGNSAVVGALTVRGIQATVAGSARVYVQDCRIIDTPNIGILFINVADGRIESCLVQDTGQTTATGHGINIEESPNAQVIGNKVVDPDTGFGIRLASNSTDCVVMGNRVRIQSVLGNFECIAATTGSNRVAITGNAVSGGGDMGITGDTSQSSITGNVVSNAWHNGISSNGSDNVISGNTVKNSGQRPGDANNDAGIKLTATSANTVVVGNRVFDDQVTKTQEFGVKVNAGGTNNFILANDLRDSIVNLEDLGTGTIIRHNPGHSTELFARGGTILSPVGGENVIVWRAPFACTVKNVRGYRVGGTGATINARRNGVDNHLAADLSLTTADTWMDGGAVQSAAYAAGDKVEIRVVTVAGAPTQVAVQVDLERP